MSEAVHEVSWSSLMSEAVQSVAGAKCNERSPPLTRSTGHAQKKIERAVAAAYERDQCMHCVVCHQPMHCLTHKGRPAHFVHCLPESSRNYPGRHLGRCAVLR